jgi:AcrR family transcriptional regulator
MPRAYRQKRRAVQHDETRSRIIEAAIELHQTIGPAATTVTDVAERAGVGRVTVYRHFPDEPALARACSGLYFERHPFPDPKSWQTIEDPVERLRAALRETYDYHEATASMIGHVLADARDHPVMSPYHAHWERAVDVLAAPFRERGRKRALLRAGLALSLSFDSWRSLVREQGLSRDQAIDVAMRLAGATSPPPGR